MLSFDVVVLYKIRRMNKVSFLLISFEQNQKNVPSFGWYDKL